MRVKRLRGATKGLGGEHGVHWGLFAQLFQLLTFDVLDRHVILHIIVFWGGYFRYAYSPCMFFFFVLFCFDCYCYSCYSG